MKAVKDIPRDFPGCPVVRTSPFNAGSTGSVPGWAAKLPRAAQSKTPNMKQNVVTNTIKTLKNGPNPKNLLRKKRHPPGQMHKHRELSEQR